MPKEGYRQTEEHARKRGVGRLDMDALARLKLDLKTDAACARELGVHRSSILRAWQTPAFREAWRREVLRHKNEPVEPVEEHKPFAQVW